jgi:hypothetical protein
LNKQLKVLFIGTYVPKECGIATFTHDLLNSVYGEYNDVQCEVIALNNASETYNYPEEVVFQIQYFTNWIRKSSIPITISNI